MDILHTVSPGSGYPLSSASLPGSDPLSISSGNVQSLFFNAGDGVENQHPLLSGEVSAAEGPSQFPSPLMKLGSNDVPDHVLYRKQKRDLLRSHRSKNLVNPDRPYLHHPKYLEYRSRPRQDIGPDGKPVWDERTEAAFQNALVHIKPMGRKKCSQRGKPYGRNMLIAEWILRETGQKRLRKQVSSHIQVLDRFLKGIPEWDRLIKPSDERESGPADGHKFYHNSVEDMVNEQKALGGSMLRDRFRPGGSQNSDDGHGLSQLPGCVQGYNVHRVEFEMWVSRPDEWDQALHNYTRLQGDQLGPMPLENLNDWRQSFPHLQTITNDWSASSRCDLILLDASFQLMGDFPPPHSKLGIGLEVDFLDATWSTFQCVDWLKNWTCVTHTYQDGHDIAPPTYEECRSSGRCSVKPFFQSKWWASKFMSLTEGKKLAEDSKDVKAIELANARTRDFFRSLTIMQEIFAVPSQDGEYKGRRVRHPKRMAILLWKFSQASPEFAGTTTWQSLIPTPDRLATNSPMPPATETDLPPLALDTMFDCSPSFGSFEHNTHFASHPNLSYDMYPEAIDGELCQDGFMALKAEHIADFDHLQSSFEMAAAQEFMPDAHVDRMHNVFDVSHGGPDAVIEGQSMEAGNLFGLSQLLRQQGSPSDLRFSLEDPPNDATHCLGHLQDPPLTRFHVKSHRALQEQLGT